VIRIAIVAALASVALVVSSCATACGCVTPIRVLAASSLAEPLEDIAEAFPPAYGAAVVVSVSTGSSAALRTQIEQGAAADLFLSADTANAQALVDAGLTDGPAFPFATNRLVIVVPDGNPAAISSPADLARSDVTVVAAGAEVPITKYAEQLVAQLAQVPGYPADFADAYEANVATREDNVGAVTAKIALGEGDAAIVYATDALASDLATVELPPQVNVVATYEGVVLKDSNGPHAANALLDWIRRRNGLGILTSYGFSPAL
jgi:molybdate transport system substrate-binding protein